MRLRVARKRALRAAIASLALVALPVPASAQYFGRNKVQYENFDFRILETPHFDVHFYPSMEQKADDAGRMAERWYTRLTPALRDTFDRRSLVFYANSPDFQQTNVYGGLIGQGTGGITESLRGRVVMPFHTTYGETDHILGHELVHVFQYNIAFGNTEQGAARGLATIPLWVIEGMAEYLSVGREDAHTAMWLRDAVRRDDMPTLRQLSRDPRYFPYRYGQAFWAWFAGIYGDQAVERVYRTSLRQGWEQALRTVSGMSDDSLSAAWHRDVRAQFVPLMAGRSAPDSVGTEVVGQGGSTGDQNIAPVLSPDGRRVAFFSSRELFGFSLYVADARTGRIIRRLSSVASDPHFDALSFISSAGSWSPDGTKLAFVVFAEGNEEINIFDVATGNIDRRIETPGVGAVSDPAWSPDGNRIAFSGHAGGVSDLYIVELATGELRQLTEGRTAELQPAWSPDGLTLAYATDAGPNTDVERLVFGDMRIGLVDVASGAQRLLPALGTGKHINPHFSPDGQDVYFVSDQDGFSDIYRMNVATGQAYRVTRTVTGVSGITTLSPALTVAARDGRVLFSTFNEAGFSIRGLDATEARGTPFTPGPGTVAQAALLPPAAAQRGLVERYLASPLVGLPSAAVTYPTEPYDAGLSLDYVGVPTIGVSVGGPFGSGAQGAAAAYFADELNNRTVGVGLQAQGTIKDIGGQLFYINRENRWNWLVGASRTPYLGLGFGVGIDTLPGTTELAEVYDQVLQRLYYDEITGGVQYPFSQTRRIEFNAGVQRISQDREVRRLYVIGGVPILEDQFDLPSGDAITLGQASVAYVGDYSFFGFTSPVAGGRYRFEAAPVFGTLTYQQALADYRRYFFARPFTFAVRGMHFGRYGKDADDPRLELFLGYPTLIRGYESSSFDPNECIAAPGGTQECPVIGRLVGSRLGVLNAEIRIPLLGSPDFALIDLPFLPTELSFFADAGTAWTGAESPQLRFERGQTADRVPVTSAGVSSRINLLGYAVVEFYYAFPFQRPGKSGVFGFHLSPGW